MSNSNSPDFVAVPREPTDAMLEAAQRCDCEGEDDVYRAWARIWKAMLAAAPQSPPAPAADSALNAAVAELLDGINRRLSNIKARPEASSEWVANECRAIDRFCGSWEKRYAGLLSGEKK